LALENSLQMKIAAVQFRLALGLLLKPQLAAIKRLDEFCKDLLIGVAIPILHCRLTAT